MASIADVLRHDIVNKSKQIKDLKDTCFVTEKARKWGYVKGGKRVLGTKDIPWENRRKEGIHWDEYEYERAKEYINPDHPRWGEYRSLKKEVSLSLAALRITKIKDPLYLGPFIKCGKDHGCDYKAAQLRLDRLSKKLKKNPEAFIEVDAWKEELEAAHA